MRNLEMTYYNVYYYCNILDNLLYYFMSGPDWAPTGAQFTEPFFESEIDNFPKYSALHAFCDFAIRQLMFEEAEKQLDRIQEKYDESKIGDRKKRLKAAFEQGGNGSSFLEVDRLFEMYKIKHETFFSYLTNNINNDSEFILDSYNEFTEFDGDLDDAIEHLTREVFYVLFQNRDFLFRFNSYMANAHHKVQKRCVIPQWVKRAVKYRDRGKCVCCGKDLSGLLDCEDNSSVHYDHMVSLRSGGLNDVCNIQLLCRKCNLKKSADSFTGITYQDWYDFEE